MVDYSGNCLSLLYRFFRGLIKIPRKANKNRKMSQKTLPRIGINGPSPKYANAVPELKNTSNNRIINFNP